MVDLSQVSISGLSEHDEEDVRAILWAVLRIYEDTGFGSIHIDIKDREIDLITAAQMLKPRVKAKRAKNQAG